LFLRFLEALTNGPTIEINYTGTELIYRPGAILGGPIDFDCGTDRCISYFLEPCLILAPFSKLAFKLKLAGLTANEGDTSIDIVRTVYLKIMAKFGIFEGVDLKVFSHNAVTCSNSHPL
jgi:RNA 3'-terminal phosphate cyclase-like protein